MESAEMAGARRATGASKVGVGIRDRSSPETESEAWRGLVLLVAAAAPSAHPPPPVRAIQRQPR